MHFIFTLYLLPYPAEAYMQVYGRFHLRFPCARTQYNVQRVHAANKNEVMTS
jgi:hypothetical protein